jgi:dephospho-CoA kinase
VVTASPAAVVERVHAERNLAPEDIAARVAAQISDAERCRHATVVIENTGSLDELRRRVRAEWERGSVVGG